METAELEEKIYSALVNDTELMDLLPDKEKSIFHLQAPSDDYPRNPIIVYTPISDVPVLAGDDLEALHRVIIRIHIITVDGAYRGIYGALKRIMNEVGFSRYQTTPIIGRGKKILTADFKIVIGG